MASTIGAGEERRTELRFDVLIGEALFASTLATLLLVRQIAAGRMSHEEADSLLDGATLVLERHRGANAESAAAVDHARARLDSLIQTLQQLRA